jgi:hypothetical protein
VAKASSSFVLIFFIDFMALDLYRQDGGEALGWRPSAISYQPRRSGFKLTAER